MAPECSKCSKEAPRYPTHRPIPPIRPLTRLPTHPHHPSTHPHFARSGNNSSSSTLFYVAETAAAPAARQGLSTAAQLSESDGSVRGLCVPQATGCTHVVLGRWLRKRLGWLRKRPGWLRKRPVCTPGHGVHTCCA